VAAVNMSVLCSYHLSLDSREKLDQLFLFATSGLGFSFFQILSMDLSYLSADMISLCYKLCQSIHGKMVRLEMAKLSVL